MQFVGNKGRFLKSQIKLQLPWNTVFFYNKLTCERRNFWNYGAFNLTTEKVCHIQSNYGNNFPRRVFLSGSPRKVQQCETVLFMFLRRRNAPPLRSLRRFCGLGINLFRIEIRSTTKPRYFRELSFVTNSKNRQV